MSFKTTLKAGGIMDVVEQVSATCTWQGQGCGGPAAAGSRCAWSRCSALPHQCAQLQPISPTTPPCARSDHHSTPGVERRWCMHGATSARAPTRAGWRVPSAGHASCERWAGLQKHGMCVGVASTARMPACQLRLPSHAATRRFSCPLPPPSPCSAAACAGASRTPGKAATHLSSHPTAPRSPSTLRWCQPPRGSACGTSKRELEGVRHTSQGMRVHGLHGVAHILMLLRCCRSY